VSGKNIEIVRRTDNALVSATMFEAMAPKDLLIVDQEWAPERSRIMQELLKHAIPRADWPQSLHWNWSRKSSQLQLLAMTGFGIVCDQQWQGLMLTKTGLDSRHQESTGKPIVYIDYLESAPRNWVINQIGQRGVYKAIGSVLIRRAIIQSRDENFRGRIGLHALPQASAFYQGLGMVNLGNDPTKSNLPYFELTEANASAIIGEKGEQQ
jgi:hypothetical protein